MLNDIAIMELEKELIFGDSVEPIPVALTDFNFNPSTICIVSGWGLTRSGILLSNFIKK